MSVAGSHPLRLAPVRGRALDGTPCRLPDELPGERTLVVVAFRQRHQRDVDRWIGLAVDLGVPASPLGAVLPMPTAVIEVPLLGRRWLPVRRFIDGGMATGIADPVVLARTITAYTDPVAFRRACGLRGGGMQVEVLLAGRDGSVAWSARGAPGEGSRAALAAALSGVPGEAQPSDGGGGGGGAFQPGPGSDPEPGPGPGPGR
jgi:hypothetical protein